MPANPISEIHFAQNAIGLVDRYTESVHNVNMNNLVDQAEELERLLGDFTDALSHCEGEMRRNPDQESFDLSAFEAYAERFREIFEEEGREIALPEDLSNFARHDLERFTDQLKTIRMIKQNKLPFLRTKMVEINQVYTSIVDIGKELLKTFTALLEHINRNTTRG